MRLEGVGGKPHVYGDREITFGLRVNRLDKPKRRIWYDCILQDVREVLDLRTGEVLGLACVGGVWCDRLSEQVEPFLVRHCKRTSLSVPVIDWVADRRIDTTVKPAWDGAGVQMPYLTCRVNQKSVKSAVIMVYDREDNMLLRLTVKAGFQDAIQLAGGLEGFFSCWCWWDDEKGLWSDDEE